MNKTKLAGKASWKFDLRNEILDYALTHQIAVKKFYFYVATNQSFDIYKRTNDGWIYFASYDYSDKCDCGRLYSDTENGQEFRWKDSLTLKAAPENMMKIFTNKTLCMVCFYEGELKKGRWAPKFVKKQLGYIAE